MAPSRKPTTARRPRTRSSTGIDVLRAWPVTIHPWPAERANVDAALRARLMAMEAELQRLGLPAMAWREIILLPLAPGDLDEPHQTRLLLDPFGAAGRALTDRVVRSRDVNSRQAYWTAAVARVSAEVLETGDAERRHLLGRLLERCEAFRLEPERHKEAYRRAAHQRHLQDPHREQREELYTEIRALAEKLKRRHNGPHTVAVMIQRNPVIQERARAINRNRAYSVSAIKKIIAAKR